MSDKNWLATKADELAAENESLTATNTTLMAELARKKIEVRRLTADKLALEGDLGEATRDLRSAQRASRSKKSTAAKNIEEEHDRFYSGLMGIINNPTMPRDHVQSQLLGLVQGTERWRRDG